MSTTTTQTPTFIFVHGAGHTSETWKHVTPLLHAKGYKSIAVQLASTKRDPKASLADDIAVTREAIVSETSNGRDVIVVVHSYGGLVGCSAVKGLARSTSPSTTSEKGGEGQKQGHVIGIALMASGFPKAGFSFIDGLGGSPPPSWEMDFESGFAKLTTDPRLLFYHDLPVSEGEEWVSKIIPHSLRTLTEGGGDTYEGWRDVPCWFLVTTEDRALPPEMQRMLVQMVREEGADVTLREIDSSHSPMLSRPGETVEFLLEAAEAFVKGS